MKAIHKIRRLRNERRISEKEMASFLGIAQNTYSRIESGKARLKHEHVLAICKKFEISICEFTEDEDNTPEKHSCKSNIGNEVEQYGQILISHFQNEQKQMIEYLKRMLDTKESLITLQAQQISRLIVMIEKNNP